MKTRLWLILVFTYSWSLLHASWSVFSSPVFDEDEYVDGRGEPGNDVFTLGSILPEKPTNLTITAVTDSVIELTWNQKNVDVLQGHNVNYKTVKNGRPGTLHVQERLTGSAEATTVPTWPTIPNVKADGGITKLDFRLQDLEPTTKYSITVSAFTRDKEVMSNEIVVVTGPASLGTDKVRTPPPITSIEVACVGNHAVDVIWSTNEPDQSGSIASTFYSFQYRKIIDGNRNHGTTVWNFTQIITNGRNWTRMNAPTLESSPAWYEVRIGTGFAFDNSTQRLTGEGSCNPHYYDIETVRIDPDCVDKDSARSNDIAAVVYPSTSTSTARSTSTDAWTSTRSSSTRSTTSVSPISSSTTPSSAPTLSSTETAVATAATSTSTEPNRLQTTPTQQVFEYPDQFLNDLNRKTVNSGEGIIMKIGSGEPTPVPNENNTNDSAFGSSSPTLIIVSASISTVLLLVLLVLLVWRNSKQCRGFCTYGGNYYVDDPPRLPLLGSHNNGNVGWDGDGLGNTATIICPATGGANTKNSSQTNITMTSNDDPQAQQQQQQQLKESIPIHLFPKHVTELHTDGDIGFSKEYEVIQNASLQNDQFTSEYSHHPENKLKNRYLNIVAYDHTLVRVGPSNTSSSSSGCGLGSMGNGLTSGGSNKRWTQGYINGNYIDGFQKPYAYIGTQGPLPSTFETFWNVVWEHNVTTIVMITNLIERGRKKCDMYWPKEIGSTETYGLIQVRLKNEQIMATYTLRTFVVHHLKVKKKNMKKFMGKFGPNYSSAVLCGAATVSAERTVYHYHYTNWPDHGTPSHTLPVLSFVKKSSHCNDLTNGGPIIVHCSAGVGRTGTYIVLDAMLKQINVRGDVNVFGFLRHIRSQRNFLVQTEEQYIFIHDALLEAIQSGDTNVPQAAIAAYMNTLLSSTCMDDAGTMITLLDYHFKLITDFQPKDFQTTASLKPCNIGKIRNPEYICTDGYRVLLTPKAGIEGSDYINASFLPGYDKLHEFILTQHPMESTITSFWQMLCDQNVQTVVVLSAVDDNEFPVFWPTAENEDLELDTFRVKLLEESDRVGYVLRDLSIQSLADDDELNIKMIQSSHWPYHCASIEQSIFQLVDVVMESVRETASTTTSPQGHGPVVIVDKFGGREGATFCSLMTVVKQMEFEGTVDVYMYSKLYHEQRPGVWRSSEDYLYMYRSLAELTSGECVMKEDEDAEEASTSASSSVSTSNASSATGPPSPATEPAVSSSNTPFHGIENQKKEPVRDEVVVVVQIDNEIPESDQLSLPTIAPQTKPDSPVSSNSSVALCMSQNSPTSDRPTCEHILNPVQQARSTNNSISPPLMQQISQPANRMPDLDFMPTLSAARAPSPKEKEPVARAVSAPSPTVSLGLGKANTNGLLRTTPSPVALKTPSPTNDQPRIFPSPLVSSATQKTPSPTAKSPPPPLANGNEKSTSPRPTSTPILKTPSPVNTVKTPSPKQGLSPVASKTAPTPSPTRSENDASLIPPIVQTPSPLKYEKEPSLSSIPTPSPPPPPLPSSPPPPGTMDQGWDDVVVVNDPNLLTITPPPPPQALLESPVRPARGNGKGASPSKIPSPSAIKQDNELADEAANLPPPPILTGNEENGDKNGIAEQHEMTKMAQAQNGKQETHSPTTTEVANSNGNGVRSLLLEEIKEEDEGSGEERSAAVKVNVKVQETEIGNGHAKNSA